MLVTKKRLRSAFPDGLKINCMRPSRPAVSCRSAPVFVLVFVRSLSPLRHYSAKFTTAKSTVWTARTNYL